MPTVPDRRAVVDRVNRSFPHLLRSNTAAACVEFLSRVLQEPEMKAERWGFLTKPGPGALSPAGFTFPNSQIKVAVDVIALPSGARVDIIQSSDNPPHPAGPTWNNIPEFNSSGQSQWRSTDVWMDPSPIGIFDSGTSSHAGVTNRTALGASLFCFMAGLKFWPHDLGLNLKWIREHIRPKVWRVMPLVDGRSHGDPDPWRDAGSFLSWPDYDDLFKRMLDVCGDAGEQAHITLYGGRNQTPTEDSRRRYEERIVRLCDGRWPAVRSFECMNEYRTNRWTDAEVRATGRHMRQLLPSGFRLSLSSPELAHASTRETTREEMGEAFEQLYGGQDHAGANECTIHVSRDRGSRWSDPFSFNEFMPDLQKINNEPGGPGASAGAEGWGVMEVTADYQRTIEAGWPLYVVHTEWGVWNGRLPMEYYNGLRETKNVWEHRDIFAIADALTSLSTGVAIFPPPTTPPSRPLPAPLSTSVLMAGMSLLAGQAIESPNRRFTLQYQADGNLVLYDNDTPVWASATNGAPGSVQMQPDGNLVIYNDRQHPVWASGTDGHAGAMLQLQDDGNAVLYKDGRALWATR